MTGEGGGLRTRGASKSSSLTAFARIGGSSHVHHGHMPEIEVTAPGEASGTWAMEDHLWWPEGSPIRRLHGYGHYHETYARTGDGWRISSLASRTAPGVRARR